MASQAFVGSRTKEIIRPGVEQLMESRYFTDLRTFRTTAARLALQHYPHNLALLKNLPSAW
jgi:hypothetical protein